MSGDGGAANMPRFALVGNPNCGKTALFNALTGGKQKTANYAGVTVERKEGRFVLPSGKTAALLDLPGAYSLQPTSLDEVVTRDVIRGMHPNEPAPDVLVCVCDATNLRLHLRFVLEVMEMGVPMVVALNMSDAAKQRGVSIDAAGLSASLGVPVVETVAIKRGGVDALRGVLESVGGALPKPNAPSSSGTNRHEQTRALMAAHVSVPQRTADWDQWLDRWALHPVLGLAILALLMFVLFQAVYVLADPFMGWIEAGTEWLGGLVGGWLPEGPLQSLMVDGVVAGLGGVVVFLPQILILFLGILLLEQSGYLPRAAFLLDKLMFRAGLSGRSFIPLLSSFACAVPGIMATRSIQDPRDRLATILVAPLMTCSARLPVYALLIGAFIPNKTVLGFLSFQGLTLFALYLAGIVSALVISWIMKRWRKDKQGQSLLLELPSYRIPTARDILLGLWERAMIFLKRVGGIILAMTILLWVLLTFPAAPADATMPAIQYSFAGQIGRALEVVFAPVGFNWQICIALIPGMAAREVAVSSLATVYALNVVDDDAATQALTPLLTQDWSVAMALSLLVWFIYAPQCLSTWAVIKRETGSWKIMLGSGLLLFSLAYVASLITYQVAVMLGAG